jgi:hypothetical protein
MLALIPLIGPIISAAIAATTIALAASLQKIGVIGPVLSALIMFIAF